MAIPYKAKIFAFTGLALMLAAGNIFLLSKKNVLTREFNNTKQILADTVARLQEARAEKDDIAKENEKLSSDAASYLAINTKLQNEKEILNKAVDDAKKTLESKEANLQRLKTNLEALEKKMAKEMPEKESKMAEESKSLRKKIDSLDRKLKKERSTYYYNLGVAYTQAKYYEEAIRAYESSLKFDPNNADAHYNLALAYDTIRDDRQRAIYHYRAYLKLRPQAPDRDEIKAAITNLK
ncbi:MAG: tetratricopeptide repeat protein [Candidatus Omnitrophica bacterium]|nr:tetratricopeptide repeat protein [Candidatus Omnitrophota bacterium]